MPHYCDIAPGHPIHGPYHDKEYGFPSKNESVIFERMALEIMQAGLSWEIVLKKRAAMQKAFDGFEADKVAVYTAKDVERLLGEEVIIRNRKKIEAIIANAAVIQTIRGSHGSLAKWLDSHAGQGKEAWVKVMRKTFRFMGPEIVGEFLMSLGYLEGAHRESCPVYAKIRGR
ncbi:MAG: DNA-3-methyladenine glycosylase I [Proteobacteria bacterium]|jgi:DNA-3-methyladenine glycosylase I|nr:DNA-3-methyladenine glycosylase I [Alphaproteobacteria bacterium]NCC02907.1 DNA-3-methyladenine glycosylase I [Pseudomonadota bacterium]